MKTGQSCLCPVTREHFVWLNLWSLKCRINTVTKSAFENLDTTMAFKLRDTLLGIICWKFYLVWVTNDQKSQHVNHCIIIYKKLPVLSHKVGFPFFFSSNKHFISFNQHSWVRVSHMLFNLIKCGWNQIKRIKRDQITLFLFQTLSWLRDQDLWDHQCRFIAPWKLWEVCDISAQNTEGLWFNCKKRR